MRNQGKFKVGRSSAGLGLYAKSFFQKDDFVIEYKGRYLNNSQADEKGGKYLFRVNSRLTIDGSGRKNIARYLNHSCLPNCEALQDGKRIVIHAKRKISPGEELTYNYGKEYFDEFIRPLGCRCQKCQVKKALI